MGETSSYSGSGGTQPQEQGEVLVSQCLSLLSQNDDTSRFVGLAMVLSISNHVADPTSVFQRCAAALKPSFLDRLLRAGKCRYMITRWTEDLRLTGNYRRYETEVPRGGDTDGRARGKHHQCLRHVHTRCWEQPIPGGPDAGVDRSYS